MGQIKHVLVVRLIALRRPDPEIRPRGRLSSGSVQVCAVPGDLVASGDCILRAARVRFRSHYTRVQYLLQGVQQIRLSSHIVYRLFYPCVPVVEHSRYAELAGD